jgi:hypothetical protein
VVEEFEYDDGRGCGFDLCMRGLRAVTDYSVD